MLKAIKNIYGHKPRMGFKGWKYPGQSYVFEDEYETIYDLVNHVRKFEKANELPHLEHLADILEDHFCKACKFFRQYCEEVPLEELGFVDKVRRVISGGKAIAKIKTKAVAQSLRVLPLEEVRMNVDTCVGCNYNRYAGEIGHEGIYVHDVEKAYGVDKIQDVELVDKEKLGQCYGCGCKVTTKVFLHEENYGTSLTENPHDINRLLNARTGNGEPCWQLKRVLRPEHLEEAMKKGFVNKADLKKWGYN